MQGKYAETEPLYERSQTIREKVLGQEHPDVAQSLNNRAGLLMEQVGPVKTFPGNFSWYPIDFESAQHQGGVVEGAGESHKKLSGIFVASTFVGE